MMRNNAIVSAVAALAMALAVSCASAPNALEPGKREAKYRYSVELTPAPDGKEGSFKLTGIYPERTWIEGSYARDETGAAVLEPNAIHWFNNWRDGWTEARFECSGKLALSRSGDAWKAVALEPIAIGEPTAAGIRYRDTVLAPDAALKQMGNRWARILATAEILRGSGLYGGEGVIPPFDSESKKARGSAFRAVTARYLFPEVAGWASGELKAKYAKTASAVAEDIRWKPAYTTDTFPEEFREVRDSGTLFRDWEESAELFYVACWNGEIVKQSLDNAIVTVREKTDKR